MADLPLDHVRNKFKKRFQDAARQILSTEPPPPSAPTLSVIFPNQSPPDPPKKESGKSAAETSIEGEVRAWIHRCQSLENELAAARETVLMLENDLRTSRERNPDEELEKQLRLAEERLEEQTRVTRTLDEKLRQVEERAAAAEQSSLEAGKNASMKEATSDAGLQELRAQLEESRTQRSSLRESFRRAEQEAASWRQRFADLEDRFSRQGKDLSEMKALFQTARNELDKLRSDSSHQDPDGPMPEVQLEKKSTERSAILHELEIKFVRQSKVIQEIQRAKEELERSLVQKDKDQQFLSAQLDRLEKQNKELVAKMMDKRGAISAESQQEMEKSHRDLLKKLAKLENEENGQEPPPQDPPQA